MRVVALAPSPAALLSLCLLGRALPENIQVSLGQLSLPLFGLIWIGLVVPLAFEMAHEPIIDRFRSVQSLRVVALLNLSSLLCFFAQHTPSDIGRRALTSLPIRRLRRRIEQLPGQGSSNLDFLDSSIVAVVLLKVLRDDYQWRSWRTLRACLLLAINS